MDETGVPPAFPCADELAVPVPQKQGPRFRPRRGRNEAQVALATGLVAGPQGQAQVAQTSLFCFAGSQSATEPESESDTESDTESVTEPESESDHESESDTEK